MRGAQLSKTLHCRRALTLVEVILSLGLFSVVVLLGLELLGRIVGSEAKLRSIGTLDNRVDNARTLVDATPLTTLQSSLAASGTYSPAEGIRVEASSDSLGASPSIALPLKVTLLDGDNTEIFAFNMLRLLTHE